MTKYYQPEIECASRDQILAWQNERLVKQVQHVWDSVPYYRKKMEDLDKELVINNINGGTRIYEDYGRENLPL